MLEQSIKRGDIYWVNLPEAEPDGNCLQRGSRPAIIVSNNLANAHSGVVEIVYLTASPKKDIPTHCTIRSSGKISTALCEQITSVNTSCLGDYEGSLREEEMAAIDCCLMISLGICNNESLETSTSAKNDNDTISKLKEELAVSRKSEEIYHRLYTDLLDKIMTK